MEITEYNQFETQEPESALISKKDQLRNKISLESGDLSTLLGTTSDSIHLVLVELAKLCESLNKATTLAEVRSSAKPLTDLLAGFIAKVNSNEVQLPYQAKGIDQVIADIENRATSVAKILINNS